MWFDAVMRPGRRLALLFAVWSLPGLMSTTQVYAQGELALPAAALWQMVTWWAWIPLTPAVLRILTWFPLERGQLPRSAAVHVLAALAVAAPHLLISALAGRAAGVAYYQATPLGELVTRLYVRHAHLDVVTYLAVLAAGAAWSYHRALEQRELAAAELRARLAESELRTLEMQLHPHFLFNTLNAIAVLVRKADGARALATVTALADFLRLTLSERGYVQIYVGKQSYLHRQSMNSLEEQLDGRSFLRIHRSAIVNVGRVRELRRQGRRELIAVLDGGRELKVGRSHRDKLARLVANP